MVKCSRLRKGQITYRRQERAFFFFSLTIFENLLAVVDSIKTHVPNLCIILILIIRHLQMVRLITYSVNYTCLFAQHYMILLLLRCCMPLFTRLTFSRRLLGRSYDNNTIIAFYTKFTRPSKAICFWGFVSRLPIYSYYRNPKQ